MLKGKYSVLAVLALLSGAVVMFADDNAASGAVAVQEPEIGSAGHTLDADSERLDGPEASFTAESDSEGGLDGENASESDSEAGDGE